MLKGCFLLVYYDEFVIPFNFFIIKVKRKMLNKNHTLKKSYSPNSSNSSYKPQKSKVLLILILDREERKRDKRFW